MYSYFLKHFIYFENEFYASQFIFSLSIPLILSAGSTFKIILLLGEGVDILYTSRYTSSEITQNIS